MALGVQNVLVKRGAVPAKNLTIGDVVRTKNKIWGEKHCGPVCYINPVTGRIMIKGFGIQLLPNQVEYLYMTIECISILGSVESLKDVNI